MIRIALKDGSVIEKEPGLTCLQVAEGISAGLARAALAAELDGKTVSLTTPIKKDCALSILTWESDEGKWVLRHTASHILAQAVKRLYPETKLAIGPAIKDGFYYDFDSETVFTPEVLEKLEAEMQKIVKENLPLTRFELPREEALRFMREKNEPYKVELIEDLPEDAVISFYTQGDFTDLCAGPHLPGTGLVKAFKLTSCTGAYWRGDSKNKMLQRIYGTAFTKKSEMDEYLARLEEAKRRDHRKLGKELDLFALMDEGPGFPFFFPRGMVLRNILEQYWREEHTRAGYEEIRTPLILNEELWHRSGHWDHYKENMYFTKIDGEDYAIKPMNCPGGMLAFKRKPVSYRDLPIRMAEMGVVHRHELSGALHGLFRVRCFTQDDAHLFMTPEQVPGEIAGVIELIDRIYKVFGFKYHVELSTCPEDFMGTQEQRELVEGALRQVLEARGMSYTVNEGDGAFYGPKIDFHLEDSIGRTWQCGTIQLDIQMPERFDLTYTGADGEKHRPVMIHRVAFGSMERFIGILIENYAGAFPAWLAPVQVILLPITDRTHEYTKAVAERLTAEGFRVETDLRNEKIGYKIREAQVQKVPYMLVLGDKEAEAGVVAVRSRAAGDLGVMGLDGFIAKLKEEVASKS
ncbi:threonine--tRNA ligase [Papillibacter cinnamivorans]|uniref:Threonine--tRNA ligase n=1 Tax=Papillibacter cinnamivorans DSM 12816 TaxID=1122930 RepID=A0A1W2BQ87_9FIRM|nr:threonine--tRNA ligase [Papillibacter cinnamivorans]SMC75155.1 threonyl-tRNA synthetase [Papillibacter cinnamivorans DSM 12816]